MRPIDADEVIDTINYYFENTQDAWRMHSAAFVDGMKDGYARARSIVSKTPTVDLVKHGHWVDRHKHPVPWDKMNPGRPNRSAYCSECGEWLFASDEYLCVGYYCPNCGAKMDEVEK